MLKKPDNYLGADLFWWIDRPDLHTLITIYWRTLGVENIQGCLSFGLFDQKGELRVEWEQMIEGNRFIVIDSMKRFPPDSKNHVEEGVLAVFVSIKDSDPNVFKKNYKRLYSIIDWYSEEGEFCTLHNDQSLVPTNRKIEFTEIVFRETPDEKTFLVILNGPERQRSKSIKLEIKNHRGEVLNAIYKSAMKPYTVTKLYMEGLFPGIVNFCDGHHVTLSGEFDALGLYLRPYVITQGRYLCGYHGGDRYNGNAMPAIKYKFLGKGEINPVMALHRNDHTTVVNLLNTHGSLEEDFWVDARLYDETGKMVASRERWLLARRDGLSRGAIKELLPSQITDFTGHIVLNFSADDKPFYPEILQALMEYSSPVNVSRLMVWSDSWNSPDRIMKKKKSKIVYRGYFRVWYHPVVHSYISLTNSGIGEDYDENASFKLRVLNHQGKERVHEGQIPPHGTFFSSLESLFPDISTFLGSPPVGLVLVESREDLAKAQLTHHKKSGVYSAEHFMPDISYENDIPVLPAGA